MKNIKKIFLFSFVLLCITLALLATPVFAMKNEPDGFRGIPWGAMAPKNNIAGGNKWGLTEIGKTDDGATVYWRLHDSVIIGGAKMSSFVEYSFHDTLGFAQVRMKFEGSENFDLLYKACVEDWGKPKNEERIQSEKINCVESLWLGEKVIIQLYYNFGTPEIGGLTIYLIDYHKARIKERANQKQRESGL